MANKNKKRKCKEPVYRSADGTRWRFINAEYEDWLMVRIKDGHRLYISPEELTLEEYGNYN